MTDILNQIDATLDAVQSMERNAARFDLTAGGETRPGTESACAMRWVPHGQDSIEEESAPGEVFPEPLGAPVATADSSPEGRRRFVAEVTAFRAAMADFPRCPACNRRVGVADRYCGPCTARLSEPVDPPCAITLPAAQFDELLATLDEPDDAPALRRAAERRRPSFTLADMEAASEAVRARRQEPSTVTVMTDAEAAQFARNLETRSLECGAMTTHLMCSGCDGAATQGWGPCLHDCHQGSEPDDDQLDADLRAINERLVEAIAEASPPVPWWRRMLGGGAR